MSKLGMYAFLGVLFGTLLIIGAPGLLIYYWRKWTANDGEKKT